MYSTAVLYHEVYHERDASPYQCFSIPPVQVTESHTCTSHHDNKKSGNLSE